MAGYKFSPEIVLDRKSLIPLRVQLETKLRRAILEERPAPGTKLISERSLAAGLGINRDTVHCAYEILVKEKLLDISPLRGGGVMISDEVRKFSLRPFPSICIILPFSFRESMRCYSAGGVEMVSGIMDRSAEYGISTNVLSMPPLDSDDETIDKWIESFIHRSNGIITLGVRTKPFDRVFERLLENKSVPHVFLTGSSKLPHIGSVMVNYAPGMHKMLSALQQSGHKKMLLITGTEESEQFFNFAYERAGIIEKSSAQYGVAVKKCIIKKEYISGKTEIMPIIDMIAAEVRKFDAIWVNDSSIARSLYDGLVQRGYKIPEDFSMIGNDMGYQEEFFSSIDYDHFSAGAEAVDLIREMFDNCQPVFAAKKIVDNTFIQRGSIGIRS